MAGDFEKNNRHHVVVVGGGFGGLAVVRGLASSPLVRATLVDRRNFHLFQPLLYQVAIGGLSPGNICKPLRSLFERQKNVRIFLAEVVGLEPEARRLRLADGELGYDSLVLAAGSQTSYFGHPNWEEHAPGLKSVEDATALRSRILLAFEIAERSTDPEEIRRCLRFVIIGGGAIGVEMAGALAEMTRHTLHHEFRHIRAGEAEILLLDAAPRVLPPYPAALSEQARTSLARLGVTVLTATSVQEVGPGFLRIVRGGAVEQLHARTLFWAAGVAASPLATLVAQRCGAELDKGGRVHVQPDCSVGRCRDVFAIGDMARFEVAGRPLPGVAQVARQQGAFVAELLRRRLAGRAGDSRFAYHDYGEMAVIGRVKAVAKVHGRQFSGFFAWLLWVLVHLAYLIGYANRLLVLVQWAWYYVTFGSNVRIITGAAAARGARLHADEPPRATRTR